MDNTNETAEPSGASGGSLAWIPVTERLPECGEEVLVYIDGHRGPAWSNNYCLVAYLGSSGRGWFEENHESRDGLAGVTHWMPLPEPPASIRKSRAK